MLVVKSQKVTEVTNSIFRIVNQFFGDLCPLCEIVAHCMSKNHTALSICKIIFLSTQYWNLCLVSNFWPWDIFFGPIFLCFSIVIINSLIWWIAMFHNTVCLDFYQLSITREYYHFIFLNCLLFYVFMFYTPNQGELNIWESVSFENLFT